ncbi:MAG: SsrA-binding protein SmpB [Deltaproteobacteria bacterium]|nr:SsrA-binding protein SmpB [Deltaproteobacteria bacterium]
MNKAAKEGRKILLRNRKALHDYAIDEQFEAGIVLLGSEVKSLRDSQGSLVDAFAEVRQEELWLVGAKINPYPWANQFNHEPERDRKLLMHKQEIRRLAQKIREKGYTLVPLEIYLSGSKVKVTLALAKGKRLYEKRESKKEAEARREIEAATARRK